MSSLPAENFSLPGEIPGGFKERGMMIPGVISEPTHPRLLTRIHLLEINTFVRGGGRCRLRADEPRSGVGASPENLVINFSAAHGLAAALKFRVTRPLTIYSSKIILKRPEEPYAAARPTMNR